MPNIEVWPVLVDHESDMRLVTPRGDPREGPEMDQGLCGDLRCNFSLYFTGPDGLILFYVTLRLEIPSILYTYITI